MKGLDTGSYLIVSLHMRVHTCGAPLNPCKVCSTLHQSLPYTLPAAAGIHHDVEHMDALQVSL